MTTGLMSLHRRSLVLFMFERCSKLTADTPQPILGHDVTITWILVLKENILTGSVGWRQRDPLRFVDGGMKPPPPPPPPPPPKGPPEEVSPEINGAFRDPDWSAILASYPDWQLAGVLPWNLGLGLRLSTRERRCVRRDILKLTC